MVKMIKYLINSIVFILAIGASCNGQNYKWGNLDLVLQDSLTYCESCGETFSEKNIGYIFNALKTDLKTNVFDNLTYKEQISFSLGKYESNINGVSEYVDCFYVTKYTAPSIEIAISIYSEIKRIPETTIHYKPSRNWAWVLFDNEILFINSLVYEDTSVEFKKIVTIVKDFYKSK